MEKIIAPATTGVGIDRKGKGWKMHNVLRKTNEGYITDSWSGLIWRQMCEPVTRRHIGKYCTDGWRLPTPDEFHGLIDVENESERWFPERLDDWSWVACYPAGYPPTIFIANLSIFAGSSYPDDEYSHAFMLVRRMNAEIKCDAD